MSNKILNYKGEIMNKKDLIWLDKYYIIELEDGRDVELHVEALIYYKNNDRNFEGQKYKGAGGSDFYVKELNYSVTDEKEKVNLTNEENEYIRKKIESEASKFHFWEEQILDRCGDY